MTAEYPRSPEYVAALAKMLDAAKSLHALAFDHMGLVAGAYEAARLGSQNERLALELIASTPRDSMRDPEVAQSVIDVATGALIPADVAMPRAPISQKDEE